LFAVITTKRELNIDEQNDVDDGKTRDANNEESYT
jgi:hypothetical protein